MRYRVEATIHTITDPPPDVPAVNWRGVGHIYRHTVEVEAPSAPEACNQVRAEVPGVVFARAFYLSGAPAKGAK